MIQVAPLNFRAALVLRSRFLLWLNYYLLQNPYCTAMDNQLYIQIKIVLQSHLAALQSLAGHWWA